MTAAWLVLYWVCFLCWAVLTFPGSDLKAVVIWLLPLVMLGILGVAVLGRLPGF